MHARLIIAKFFTFIVAIQILNLSIDVQNHNLTIRTTDIAQFNEMNSVTEFIGEKIFHHDNAFPENSKGTHKEVQFGKRADVLIPCTSVPIVQKTVHNYKPAFEVPLSENYEFLYFREINPPPPKSC